MRPHRWQPIRLPCPWDSPGKNTGVGCHFLLQCVKVKSESEVTQSSPTLSDPMDCSLPGSSVHGFSRQEYWRWVPLPSPLECTRDTKVTRLIQPLKMWRFYSGWGVWYERKPGRRGWNRVFSLKVRPGKQLCSRRKKHQMHPWNMYSRHKTHVPSLSGAVKVEWQARHSCLKKLTV